MRRQRACNLTVRFRWEVEHGHHHPVHTFSCAEDVAMAAQMAANVALTVPRGIRFAGVDVSPDGGRHIAWKALDLERSPTAESAAVSVTSAL